MTEPSPRLALAAAAAIGLFLLVNFARIGDFGRSVDENRNFERGQASWQIARGLVTPLPPDFWENRRNPLREANHPTFFSTVNHLVWDTFRNGPFFDRVSAGHILPLCVSAMGLAFLFLIGRQLEGGRLALIAVLCLALYPRFIANAHFNPKDIPLMAFGAGCLFFFIRLMKAPSPRNALLTGGFLGLSFGCELNAVLLIPIMLVGAAVHARTRWNGFGEEMSGRRWRLLGAAILFAGFIFFIAQPPLWSRPGLAFAAVRKFTGAFWDGWVPYWNVYYRETELPWHYAPVYLFIVTPLVLWPAIAAGLAIQVARLWQPRRAFGAAVVLAWLLIPLATRMVPGVVRYDGIRHIYILLPALALLAATGLSAIWELRTLTPRTGRAAGLAACGLTFLIMAVEVRAAHPFQDVYFNAVVRRAYPREMNLAFDMDNWGATYLQGVKWLERNGRRDARICADPFPEMLEQYQLRSDLRRGSIPGPGCDYAMILPPRHRPETERFIMDKPMVYEIRRYNTALLEIYDLITPGTGVSPQETPGQSRPVSGVPRRTAPTTRRPTPVFGPPSPAASHPKK